MLKNKTILITGGTGTFGKAAVKFLLKKNPKKIIIFSRDELKQYQMQLNFLKYEKIIRYFIGDVRDLDRIDYALRNVDYIVHAAALKQVPASEYNPTETIKTNINGAENIIKAAIRNNVKKVMALSTDKAANPINLYGATKLCSDKLFVAANNISGGRVTRFAITRYGNVFGSRGSVVDFFKERIKNKEKFLPITDFKMTRFWLDINTGVEFTFKNLILMQGGEIFIPKIPSIKIVDLAKAIKSDIKLKEIGLRPGEKLHEILLPKDSSHHSIEFKNYFVIMPEFSFNKPVNFFKNRKSQEIGKKVEKDFEYNSLNNKQYLKILDIKKNIK
jgi:UDP-N-acetylglucosamine 4,6-dehydratase